MKIVVCGATGFIGSAIVRKLRCEGIDIESISGEWIARQIAANKGSLPPAIREDIVKRLTGAEVVINCSGKARASVISRLSRIQSLELANIKVPGVLAEIAAGIQARAYIHLSTLAVYSGESLVTRSENENPTSVYARSKLSGDCLIKNLLRESRVACLILRFPIMIDKDTNPTISLILKWLKLGLPFPQFNGESQRSIITSVELVQFITSLVNMYDLKSGTYLIASERNMTLADIIRTVAEKHELPATFLRLPNQVEKLLFGCPIVGSWISKMVRGQVVSPEFLPITKINPI